MTYEGKGPTLKPSRCPKCGWLLAWFIRVPKSERYGWCCVNPKCAKPKKCKEAK